MRSSVGADGWGVELVGALVGSSIKVGASVAVGPVLVASGVAVPAGSGLTPVSSVIEGSTVTTTVALTSGGTAVGAGSPPNKIPVAHRTPSVMATMATPPTSAGISQGRRADGPAAATGAIAGAAAAFASVLTIRTVILSLPPLSFAAATNSCAASWGGWSRTMAAIS